METLIIFLFTVITASATEEVKENLIGTEGGSITLPDPVMEEGFLILGGKTIAMVNEGKIKIYEEIYKNKVLWNKNTGLFTITGLQRNNSGIYYIDSKVGRVFITSYKLTVYESVPTPALTEVNVGAESCSLLCSVKKTEETTLLWYKDEVIVNQSSSGLSLPLTVHKEEFNSTYRCVAANPVENETLSVNVTTSCSGQKKTDNTDTASGSRYHIAGIIVSVVLVVIVILVASIIKYKYGKNKRTPRHSEESVGREPEAEYTDVQILDRHGQGGHLCDSPPPAECSNLTTVYDKLEVHRMRVDTSEHV